MTGLWTEFYNLIIGIIGSDASFVWAEYTCQILATIATVFVFAIPFIVVFLVIRYICELIGG